MTIERAIVVFIMVILALVVLGVLLHLLGVLL
jgi:hypothetical protein